MILIFLIISFCRHRHAFNYMYIYFALLTLDLITIILPLLVFYKVVLASQKEIFDYKGMLNLDRNSNIFLGNYESNKQHFQVNMSLWSTNVLSNISHSSIFDISKCRFASKRFGMSSLSWSYALYITQNFFYAFNHIK